MPYHAHDKGEVDWDDKPDLQASVNGDIPWYGTCSCGKRVYEVYAQRPELYEA